MPDYHIRRVNTGSEEVYCLCDPEGNVVPCQLTTSLTSSADQVPVFTIEFAAGELGLQVIDEREDL